MPIITQCLTSRSAITHLEALSNDMVAYTTQYHGIKIFSYVDCETKINISTKDLNLNTTAIAFSQNSELVAFVDGNVINIIYLPTRKLIKTIRTDEKNIEILVFDPSSSYIITGSRSGRVVQYKYSNSISLSRLCSFPYQSINKEVEKKQNFVSAITFHKNFVASSGYGGAIVILDLHSRAHRYTITNSKVRTDALCFLNHEKIISGNVDGILHLYSIKERKLLHKIATPFRNIKQIIIMPNPQYIMVSAETNYVIIVDIKNSKITNYNYMQFEDSINKITLADNEKLIISLKNSELLTVELPSLGKLNSLISQKKIVEALSFVEKECMIKGSLEHKKLEKIYENQLTQAVEALINNNKEHAHMLIDKFRAIPSKKVEIDALYKAFDYFSRFRALVLDKKYALAYAMVSKYPAFKYTPQYIKMEKVWKEIFGDAQRQMMLGRNDIAKGILSEYMTTTSKRPLIKFILNHNKHFLEFLKAIEHKEYKKVYDIATENEIFSQIPTYTALNTEINQKIIHAENLINIGNTSKALTELNELKYISHIEKKVSELNERCINVEKLQSAYKDNDFKLCYNILDSNDSLDTIELSTFLEKHWSKLIIKCEEFALKGDIKAIKEKLWELLLVKSRSEKIGDLLRVSYHTKIKLLINKKSFKKAELVIYAYLDTFGLDSEINTLKTKFEKISSLKLAIEDSSIKEIKRDDWIDSKFTQHLTKT